MPARSDGRGPSSHQIAGLIDTERREIDNIWGVSSMTPWACHLPLLVGKKQFRVRVVLLSVMKQESYKMFLRKLPCLALLAGRCRCLPAAPASLIRNAVGIHGGTGRPRDRQRSQR